jgi:hypothetical protein
MAPWLQHQPAEAIVAALARLTFTFAFAGMMSIALVRPLCAPGLVAAYYIGATSTSTVAPSSTEGPLPYPRPGGSYGSRAIPSGDDENVTDLYGNDVTAAVARYKLDSSGSLYEAHSPQTQLAKLGSPKS